MPRVTMIIPTYNWSTVLPYSIASIQQQTMKDFELLVVGDGCSDESERVVSEIAAADPRVKWHNMPENSGEQATPNQWALENAGSPVVCYLNHDDLYMPHGLEVMLAAIDAGADVAHGACCMILPDGKVRLGSTGARSFDPPWWMTPSCVMHRRDVCLEDGGWIPQRVSNRVPQEDTWRRMYESKRRFEFVPRLVSIKFPAARRKNVYQEKPCHEQREYLERIRTEPDLEPMLLCALIESKRQDAAQSLSGRQLVEALTGKMRRRLAHAFRFSSNSAEVELNKRRRREKGLPE